MSFRNQDVLAKVFIFRPMHPDILDKIDTYSGLSFAAFIAPANILLAPSFGRLPLSRSSFGLLESAEPSRPIGTATISLCTGEKRGHTIMRPFPL